MWYTRNIFVLASDICFNNWTVHMSDNLPEIVQILVHAHIICITVRENRIICCQIFCDLLLRSAFERNNVMQLILVKSKWHIKWKYLIQKVHDICLSYYFKTNLCFFSLKQMSDASTNIFRVYHIRIIASTKNGSHDMKQTDSSIIIVRNVCVLTYVPQHPWLFIFSSRDNDRQSSEQNNRKLISFHNNSEDDKHAHGFADF
jgi:hypothetical protein